MPTLAPPLVARLREPEAPHSVPGTLPVLSFGDPRHATVVTLGLNPSYLEYAEIVRDGAVPVLREGGGRRFETLASLGAPARAALTIEQCERAVMTMHSYFQPGRPAYWQWFRHLENVLHGLDASFVDGSAAHLDFVQEATYPTWSTLQALYPAEVTELWRRDTEFLRWQLTSYPVRRVVCNGRSVGDALLQEVRGTVLRTGTAGRVRWWVGRAELDGRSLELAGWNYPLVRPTGLDRTGEERLGTTLLEAFRELQAEAGG